MLKTNLPELLSTYITMMENTDNEDLVVALEELVDYY